MGSLGQGQPHKWPPAPAACFLWPCPPQPAPSSASPQGRPQPLGMGPPWLGSPRRGGGQGLLLAQAVEVRGQGLVEGAQHCGPAAPGAAAAPRSPSEVFPACSRRCWPSGGPGLPCRPWRSSGQAPQEKKGKDGGLRGDAVRSGGQLSGLGSKTQNLPGDLQEGPLSAGGTGGGCRKRFLL